MGPMYNVHSSGYFLERIVTTIEQSNEAKESKESKTTAVQQVGFTMSLDVRSTIGEFKKKVSEQLIVRFPNKNPNLPFILSQVLPAGPENGFHLFRTIGGSLEDIQEKKDLQKKKKKKKKKRRNNKNKMKPK